MQPTIEDILALLAKQQAPEVVTPTIICNVDGELVCFNDETDLKKFMWSERPSTVTRYNLAGEVVVPFELETIKPKVRGPYKKKETQAE